jgi:hypothetical protein
MKLQTIKLYFGDDNTMTTSKEMYLIGEEQDIEEAIKMLQSMKLKSIKFDGKPTYLL